MYQSELSGAMTQSVRDSDGVNLNIMKQSALGEARLFQELRYEVYPNKRIVKIIGLDNLMEVQW